MRLLPMDRALSSLLFALTLLLAACSPEGMVAASPSPPLPSTSTAPPSPLPPSAASTAPASPPGTPAPQPVEQEARSCPPAAPPESPVPFIGPLDGDLDGDGQADSIFLQAEPEPQVVYVLDSGGAGSAPIPVAASADGTIKQPTIIGAADADEDGRDEVFVERYVGSAVVPMTLVQVARLVDCQLVFVQNVAGEPYAFKVKSVTAYGYGVGCVDADGDGRSDLVGLEAEASTISDGAVEWTRTIVDLEGAQATNGPVDTGTFLRPQEDEAIALLGDVSCGEETFPNEAELYICRDPAGPC